MDQEMELQKEVFGMWLKNLRKKTSMIQSLADSLSGQHGMQQLGRMLGGFAKDCEKLYELGYEIGYVQGFLASDEKTQSCGYAVH